MLSCSFICTYVSIILPRNRSRRKQQKRLTDNVIKNLKVAVRNSQLTDGDTEQNGKHSPSRIVGALYEQLEWIKEKESVSVCFSD